MVMSTYAVPDPDMNLLSVRFKQDVQIKSDNGENGDQDIGNDKDDHNNTSAVQSETKKCIGENNTMILEKIKATESSIKQTVNDICKNTHETKKCISENNTRILEKIKATESSIKQTVNDVFNNTQDSIELQLKNMKEILLTLRANYTEVNNKLDSQTIKLDALDSIELQLKNMKAIQTEANNKLDLESKKLEALDSIELQIKNMNATQTEANNKFDLQSRKLDALELQLKNMKATQIEANNKLDLQSGKLDALGCPSGFFMIFPGPQCFKLMYDKRRTWMDAKVACNNIGCVMARPADPVMLRKYLVAKHGHTSAKGWAGWPLIWLAARGGSGSNYNWDEQVGGGEITADSPLWIDGLPGSRTGSSYCLQLWNYDSIMKSGPLTPYYSSICTHTYYALCEYIKE